MSVSILSVVSVAIVSKAFAYILARRMKKEMMAGTDDQ